MAFININVIVAIGLLVAPVIGRAQSSVNLADSVKNQQTMKNKTVIGRIFVPKASIEEFRKQSVTNKFLKTLPGFVKAEPYEMLDNSGNLNLVTIATWADDDSRAGAQTALKHYYESIKFDPIAYRERLKIVAEHGIYELHDY